jgi:class 3 adenylate cyclase/pimeloyl-ACP methyl ester carboxylesterase
VTEAGRPAAPNAASEGSRRLVAILFADVVGYTARMGADEAAALGLLERARPILRGAIARHGGRVLDEIGDGTLAEFESAVAAVACARESQQEIAADPELRVRIGIHVGDVLHRDGRAFGDGVNVASRIHGLAEPSAICISEQVWQATRNQPGVRAQRLGPRRLKNVDHPIVVYQIGGARGGRRWPRRAAIAAAALLLAGATLGVPAVREGLAVAYALRVQPLVNQEFEQQIGFATSRDGVRIAYATAGSGPPLVVVLGWMTHLERGLDSPAYGGFTSHLSKRFHVVRYDGRGTGLSDRDVADFSLEARVADLEAVVDAAGLDHFVLYGISLGGPTAVSYAARHPERVTRLALISTFASAETVARENPAWDGLRGIMKSSWSADSPGMRMFSALVAPDAPPVAHRIMGELIALSTPSASASGIVESGFSTDVRPLLGSLKVPVLVVHARGDMLVPLSAGRELAAGIPGARLVVVETNNHGLPPADDPTVRARDEIDAFLAGES